MNSSDEVGDGGGKRPAGERRSAGPPRTARRLLRRLLPEPYGEDLVTELDLEFRARSSGGRVRTALARCWYWRRVLSLDTLRLRRALVKRHDASSPDPGAPRSAPHRAPRIRAIIDDLVQDLAFAVRSLRQSPGFAAVAILTLALGIGPNAAIFAVADAVLLSPPPDIGEPDRYVAVFQESARRAYGAISYPDFRELREGVDAFEALSARVRVEANLGAGDTVERVRAEVVSPGYFDVMGVRPALGRSFRPEEGRQEATAVLVLGHGLWRSSFAADPEIVGRPVRLNDRPYTVVGVAEEGFRAGRLDVPPELWVPAGRVADFLPRLGDEVLANRHFRVFEVVGRLRDGATAEQAEAGAGAVAARLEEMDPTHGDPRRFTVRLGVTTSFAPEMRREVVDYTVLLGAVVGLVLLIACFNVANLVLVRGEGRRREIALRRALGAGQARIVRQLLVEASLLALTAGAAGLVLFRMAEPALAALQLPGAFVAPVELDVRVLGFTLAMSLMTAVVFGLLPSLRGSDPRLEHELKSDAPTHPGGDGSRLRGPLVVAQVAISVVLLFSAGLLLRTLLNLRTVDAGFDTRNILTARLDPGPLGYDDERGRQLFARLLEEIRAVRGVSSASLTSDLPLDPEGSSMSLYIEGRGGESHPDVNQSIVDVGFFRAMGITVLRGRGFSERDVRGSARNVVINESMAERFWPGTEPIGEGVGVGGPDGPFYRVIGVVEDHRQDALDADPAPHLFWSFRQIYAMMSGSAKSLVIRTDGEPLALASSVRQIVGHLAPSLPLTDLSTMSERLRASLHRERQAAILLSAIGIVALMLAAGGIYGVVSFTVARRTPEIGVRMALGAAPGDTLRLVVRHGMLLVAAGVALGAGGCFAVARLFAGMIYGVPQTDPLTLAAAGSLVLGIAFLGTYVPARRAAGLDPVRALRVE